MEVSQSQENNLQVTFFHPSSSVEECIRMLLQPPSPSFLSMNLSARSVVNDLEMKVSKKIRKINLEAVKNIELFDGVGSLPPPLDWDQKTRLDPVLPLSQKRQSVHPYLPYNRSRIGAK